MKTLIVLLCLVVAGTAWADPVDMCAIINAGDHAELVGSCTKEGRDGLLKAFELSWKPAMRLVDKSKIVPKPPKTLYDDPCERFRIEYHSQTTFAASGRVILFRIAQWSFDRKEWIEAYKNTQGRYFTTLRGAQWWLNRYKTYDGCKTAKNKTEEPPALITTEETESLFRSMIQRPDWFAWKPWNKKERERLRREITGDMDMWKNEKAQKEWWSKHCQ